MTTQMEFQHTKEGGAHLLLYSQYKLPSELGSTLIPREDRLDDSNIQILPPGFHVVYLPYSEDICTLNIESTVKADAEQVRIAKAVINKLRFAFTPYSFDDPKLKTHWWNTEALALNYNEQTEVKDVTVSDHESVAGRPESLAQEFLDSVYISGYVPGEKPKVSGGRKRAMDTYSDKPRQAAKNCRCGKHARYCYPWEG